MPSSLQSRSRQSRDRFRRRAAGPTHIVWALGLVSVVIGVGVFERPPIAVPEAPQRPEQTVDVHKASFAVQPLGVLPEALIRRHADRIEERFGQPVRILEARPMPEAAWNAERRQYRAGAVLDAIYIHKPTGITHVIAVTAQDLYEDGWEYLYGYSQVQGQVAVFSLARTMTPGQGTRLSAWRVAVDRAEKVLVHELGHSMSLTHCTRSHCVMSAVDTNPELDRLSRFFCRRCANALHIEEPEDAAVARGDGLFHRGAEDRALVRYVTAMLQRPTDAARINRVGVAAAPVLGPAVASRAYRLASFHDPENPLPWYNMGLLYAAVDVKMATELFHAGFERDPERVEALGFMGMVYAEVLDDEHRALRYFQRYVGEGGQSPRVMRRYRSLLTPSVVDFGDHEGSVIRAQQTPEAEEMVNVWEDAMEGWTSPTEPVRGPAAQD